MFESLHKHVLLYVGEVSRRVSYSSIVGSALPSELKKKASEEPEREPDIELGNLAVPPPLSSDSELEEIQSEEEEIEVPPQAFLPPLQPPGQSMVTSITPNINDNNSENPVCTICWDVAPPPVAEPGGRVCFRCTDGQDVRVLPCGHSYHRACIKRWWVEADRLGQPRSCPTCRQQAPIKFHNACWKSLSGGSFVVCILKACVFVSIIGIMYIWYYVYVWVFTNMGN
tara:strand:- start:410 stop:1090 length:681 start_codon:yes stop_codon:yes gene_type:complete